MRINRGWLIFASILWSVAVNAQLTVETCQQKARENYPLIKRYELIGKSKEYNLTNAARGYLPQVALSAKATYQSEVTEIPVKLPGLEIDGLSKDQYQAVVEVNQAIWDGGVINKQKKITKASSAVEEKQLEVDLYTLNERVNDLFFGILLLNEQLKQNALLQDELKRNYAEVASYIINGIANQADLDAVKVNQLNAIQKQTELEALRTAYQEMLSVMIGEMVKSDDLLKPALREDIDMQINRPELYLMDAQYNQFEVQKSMLTAKNLPKLGAFVQGGIGNPGLNMLKNEFSPYYIAGLKLSWNFGGLYTKKNDRRLLETNQSNIDVQRETFLFNTGLQLTQQNNEVEKIRKLMQNDDEIIRLRENIRKASEVKVRNGTLTVTDMLRDITAEDQARQDKLLHEVQLLMTIYEIKNTTNN
ncbi:MAG: TolC family protein [Bacteroidales bacterium]|nr:TolC family protein [Bacteroidales bacterium]